jgi:hypothetical protein
MVWWDNMDDLRGYKINCTLLAVAMSLLLIACSKNDEPKSRPFRMGFTVLPDIAAPGTEDLYEKLSVESDIVNYYFDDGVPWNEALSGGPLPNNVMEDWGSRKGRIKSPHKVYVSVTPINHSHSGLASYGGMADTVGLCAPWNGYSFNNENVKTAYLNYCTAVIDFFKPDYFAMSIEANLLFKVQPAAWSHYLDLHEYIYRQLKTRYPKLPIFSSVSGAPLLKGFLNNNDHVMQRLAAMQLLEMSDYYAISFYPPVTTHESKPWPENTFDELLSLSTRPVIIAETAYTAKSSAVQPDDGKSIFPPDPIKQKIFLETLLAAAQKWKAKFVIWFTLRDPQVQTNGVMTSLSLRDAGLYDRDGNPRPALNSWREYFKRVLE